LLLREAVPEAVPEAGALPDGNWDDDEEELPPALSPAEIDNLTCKLPGHDGSCVRNGFEKRRYTLPSGTDEATMQDIFKTLMNILLLKAKRPGYVLRCMV
jgi:hypothetical protein